MYVSSNFYHVVIYMLGNACPGTADGVVETNACWWMSALSIATQAHREKGESLTYHPTHARVKCTQSHIHVARVFLWVCGHVSDHQQAHGVTTAAAHSYTPSQQQRRRRRRRRRRADTLHKRARARAHKHKHTTRMHIAAYARACSLKRSPSVSAFTSYSTRNSKRSKQANQRTSLLLLNTPERRVVHELCSVLCYSSSSASMYTQQRDWAHSIKLEHKTCVRVLCTPSDQQRRRQLATLTIYKTNTNKLLIYVWTRREDERTRGPAGSGEV